MALYLEPLGLGWAKEDEDTFVKLVHLAAERAKGIKGYYGIPYLNAHFGNVQMIMQLKENENGYEMTELSTHATGIAVWDAEIKEMDLNRTGSDKLSKRIVVTRADNDSGLAVVTLVNADVLPCFNPGERIRMQMIGFPEQIEYFENGEAYEDKYTKADGMSVFLSDGLVFPSGLLQNRNPDSPQYNEDEHLDDIVIIRGTVKNFRKGKFALDEPSDAFLYCDIDTEFGPLEIVHSYDMIPEEQRGYCKAGATVLFVGLLAGDVAIGEYENGVVYDEAHDLAVLRDIFAGGDPERLRSILTENAVYWGETNRVLVEGPDEIIARLQYVQKSLNVKCTPKKATVRAVAEGDHKSEYGPGKSCVALYYGDPQQLESIAFVDVDEAGMIVRITTSTDPQYSLKIEPDIPVVSGQGMLS